MTRKDYVLLASVFAATRPRHDAETPRRAQWQRDVAAMADTLAADNLRFDSDRFIRACNGVANPVPGDHRECGPDCTITGDRCDGITLEGIPETEPTPLEKFGRETLDILVDDPEWSGDTLETIQSTAFALKLADADDEGMFRSLVD